VNRLIGNKKHQNLGEGSRIELKERGYFRFYERRKKTRVRSITCLSKGDFRGRGEKKGGKWIIDEREKKKGMKKKI